MPNRAEPVELELVCTIVNFGLGSKAVSIGKKNGVSGGTIFLGKGTVHNRLLELLALTDVRKEIAIMICEKATALQVLEEINRVFHLDKPNHGIAFSISVSDLQGVRDRQYHVKESRGGVNIMHRAIFVVVDRGNAESVIEAANKGGARGGTIINARGSGIHETSVLFAMPIEPEKEVVLILADENVTDSIVSSIRQDIRIDEPGKGIVFVLDVTRTYGLRQ